MADGTKIIGVHLGPENKLLLIKKDNIWDFPGGSMRPEEKDYDCLIRTITKEQFPYCTLKIHDLINLFFVGDYDECERILAYKVEIKSNIAVGECFQEAEYLSHEDVSKIKENLSKTVDRLIIKFIKMGLL